MKEQFMLYCFIAYYRNSVCDNFLFCVRKNDLEIFHDSIAKYVTIIRFILYVNKWFKYFFLNGTIAIFFIILYSQWLCDGATESRREEFVRIRCKWRDANGAGSMHSGLLHTWITATDRPWQRIIPSNVGPRRLASEKIGHRSAIWEIGRLPAETLWSVLIG